MDIVFANWWVSLPFFPSKSNVPSRLTRLTTSYSMIPGGILFLDLFGASVHQMVLHKTSSCFVGISKHIWGAGARFHPALIVARALKTAASKRKRQRAAYGRIMRNLGLPCRSAVTLDEDTWNRVKRKFSCHSRATPRSKVPVQKANLHWPRLLRSIWRVLRGLVGGCPANIKASWWA